jgi:sulfur carrier protein ThiS adenylyltransferase
MIKVNEKDIPLQDGMTLHKLKQQIKPEADITVYNGFPVNDDIEIKAGDRICFIRKGEIPEKEEMKQLIVSRHSPEVYEKVFNKCIGVAGAGGLGSSLAVALARLSVGKLIIADFDVVEPSNLNRQQFFIDQIGILKVDALKENLERINPFLEVVAVREKLDKQNIPEIFSECDVIAECFDNPEFKSIIVETVLRTLKKPIVAVSGIAGYNHAEKLVCRKIMKNLYMIGDGITAAAPGMGLMAPKVGIAAHLQANKILEILLEL